MSFLVRIYRYDGSDSTIATYPDLPTAQWHAASLNQATQSTQYRAEEYDPEKARKFHDHA